MPVDAKASEYQWYMDVKEDLRIVRWKWVPENGVITSSLGIGDLSLEEKTTEGEWITVELTKLANPIMWAVAQNIARSQGFAVEVVKYANQS